MSTCLRCGSPYQPHHKFCGTCAAPLAPSEGAQAAQISHAPGYGAPPAPQAAPQPARCQLGHEIAQGFTYCAHGHPIALEAMQLAGVDAFGGQAYRPAPEQAPAQPYGPTGAMSPFPHAPSAPHAPPPQPPPPAPVQAAPVQAAPPQPPSFSTADTAPQATPGGRRQLMGFLVSFHGDPLGAFYPLYAGLNRVGRAGAADGLDVAIADPATSSTHANLHLDPATFRVVLEDLGSTNGSFVNEERLPPSGHRDLQSGDLIRFGSYTAKLLLVPQR